MPTLIRFLVVLLLLAGIAVGAMIALTVMVTPEQHEIENSIPARELFDQ
ncbi:hypothetical protein [Cucumibacter marinus]|nr:hypothetical protein [Cucumibacter marinus]